jgi:hypothetical protein
MLTLGILWGAGCGFSSHALDGEQPQNTARGEDAGADESRRSADGGAADAGGAGEDTATGSGASAQDDGTIVIGDIRAEPVDGASYFFDSDVVRTYELRLSEADLAAIDADPRAEQYVEGTLAFEGDEYGPVGIRYKGSIGAFRGCTAQARSGEKTCTKLSMKVKINWQDPDHELRGVRKLQFHSMNRDPSMLKERLGYWVFRQFGIAAPRAVHAKLVVNGELLGLFALVEQVDGRFTRSRFLEGGKGNLYKEAWPLQADGSPTSEDELFMQLETNEDESPTFEGMRGLGEAVAEATPTERPEAAFRYTDLDYTMRYLAVDRTIGHDDGPLHWYCVGGAASCYSHNFYWYEAEGDGGQPGPLWIVAWDLDSAFNVDNPITTLWFEWDDPSYGCATMTQAPYVLPLRHPTCDPLQHAWAQQQEPFLDAVQALIEGPMRRDLIEDKLQQWEQQITPHVREAAALHADAVTLQQWEQARAALRDAIDMHLSWARERIAAGPRPQSDFLQ